MTDNLRLLAAADPSPALPGASPETSTLWLFVLRSMNMGFFPSLSSCLKRMRGFSSRPRHRSWSPYTMYSAYWSAGALIWYLLSAAGRTF